MATASGGLRGDAPEPDGDDAQKTGLEVQDMVVEGHQDLADAVSQARRVDHDKVDLFVHDPSQPPIPITLEPQPAPVKAPTPPELELKERNATVVDEDQPVAEYPNSTKGRESSQRAGISRGLKQRHVRNTGITVQQRKRISER